MYLFRVNSGNSRTIGEIRRDFIDVVPFSFLLTLAGFTHCSAVSNVDLEQVNTG